MAYDVKKVTKLGHLRQLMDKSRQELASKTALEELAEQVDGIIAEGGEPNVITGVKVNGTALEVTDKAVDVPVPVRVSQLDNDSGFQTLAQVQAAVAAVDLSGKQDKLTGTQGQVVGFDAQGQAVAQDAPEGGGLTQAQADGRYFRIGESGHGTQELRLENHTGATSWKVLFQRASDNSILISPTKEEATTNRVILAGISEPEFDDDAANKKYVDSLSAKSGFPSGGIIIWSGASDAVPSGWALCDGANGTPDLRGRFVVGAGGTYAVGASGGEAVHTLTENEMPRHRHDLPGEIGYNWLYDDSSQGQRLWIASDDPHDVPDPETDYTGGGQPHNNLPPYYALCYIMKL